MINDSIDILDANIINLQISFKIVAFPNINKYSALDSAKQALELFFADRKDYEIGEPFGITDIFTVLKNTPAVLDVVDVDVIVKSGGDYADSNFIANNNKIADGRKIFCPLNSVFEIKYPNADLVGTVI